MDTGSALERIYGRDANDQSISLHLGVGKDQLVCRAVFCKFATVAIDIHGEILQVAVVVIDPLTYFRVGCIVTMYC